MQVLKRRIYLIDRKFQLKFIRWFLFAALLVAVAVGGAAYQILNHITEQYLYSPHIPFDRSGDILRPALLRINLVFFIILIIITAVLVSLHLRQVSGSLKRFAAHLAEMGSRLIPRMIHFRRNDPLHGVAEDFNVMATSVERKVADGRDHIRRAADELHDLAISHEAGSAISAENIREIQSHLTAAVKKLEFEAKK